MQRFVAGCLLPFGVIIPSASAAQFTRTHQPYFGSGVATGLPFTLYNGSLVVSGGPVPDSASVTTQYEEKVLRPISVGAFGEWQFGRTVGLRAGIGVGSSPVEATFSGGRGAPQTFRRSASWTRVEFSAAYPIDLGQRWELWLGGGLLHDWWTLRTDGQGRDALAQGGTGGAQPRVEWSDIAWQSGSGLIRADVAWKVTPQWRFDLQFRQQILGTEGRALSSVYEQNVRESTGENFRIDAGPQKHSALPLSLGVSLSWTPGRRVSSDPGPAAVAAVAAASHQPSTRSMPDAARAAVSRGDTASAISILHEEVESGRASPELRGELGVLLAARAGSEEQDLTRVEARAMLRDGLKADPDNPRYYAALATVLEKGGMWTDARTVAGRALAMAAKRPSDISSRELAEVFYRRARTLREHVADFHHLRLMPVDGVPVTREECMVEPGSFCLNWDRPRAFFEIFEGLPDVTEQADDDREAMLGEYRRALEMDPSHLGANRGLLAALAAAGEFQAFAESAEAWATASPDDPSARLFALLAPLYQDPAAEVPGDSVRQVIATLPLAERGPYLDLSTVLRPSEGDQWRLSDEGTRSATRNAFWRARDPLFLSQSNEREMAHYARVGMAHLLFGEPQSGRAGWETERGRVWIRYGAPATTWQVRRDDRMAATMSTLEGTLGTASSGGRWIFWNYDPHVPSFVFEKDIGRSSVTPMAFSQTMAMIQDEAARNPTFFAAPFTHLGELRYQAAAFRSRSGAGYDVEIHGELPPALGVAARDGNISAGFFLLEPAQYTQVQATRLQVPAAVRVIDAKWTNVFSGSYSLAVEAATSDRTAVAASRDTIQVGSSGRPRLSDLLLVHSLGTRAALPSARTELDVDPLRCMAVPESRRLFLVFEIYDLGERQGMADYEVAIEVETARSRGLFVRVLRSLAGVVGVAGEEEPGSLRFRREVPLEGDRTLEWLELELPEGTAEAGVTLRVSITDRISGSDNALATARLASADACDAGDSRPGPGA